MPIANVNDAIEVRAKLADLLNANSIDRRVDAVRALFIETLDWQYSDGLIPLHRAQDDKLPLDARLIASRDGISAVYIPPASADTNRITAAIVNAAARSLDDTLEGDLLLLFTNSAGDEFHFVRPDLTHARPRLQRMVARRGERHRTIEEQLANMWNDYGRIGKSVHEAIISAFSVEPVTKRFFAEYRRVFEDAKEAISGFEGERELHLFTQTLFNRLMFVYFISRKGWLNFRDDTDYLNALWRSYESGASQSNFYTARLEPMFFAGLNNPRSRNLKLNNPALYDTIGDVPFLNGGLFDKNDLDRRGGFTIPDNAIKPILARLFDRFNFTVTESTPYDTEVAVDPEMLGKVFEELVNERQESGAYYTPRPVVSFMCREALKGYIASRHPELEPDLIGAFVDDGRGDVLPRSVKASVATSLDEVTTVDPACGSGAYLLGMLQELIVLRDALFNESGEADPRDEYQRKLHIISRNLYGADIDSFAVNIAMLRLWLSLVIEYEGDNPEPLPNLDFKVTCGDSLLAPDPDPAQQGNIFTQAIRGSGLADLKSKYMRARTQSDKDRLRAEIEAAQSQIRDTLGDAESTACGIDWRVEAAEVMGTGGFDIVIANPPYIQLQRDRGRLGQLYKDVGYSTFIRSGDIYQLFYERGCQILKPSTGLLAYITSNSWLKAEYGKRSRRYFSEQHTPLALLELGKDVFKSAIVDSSVVLVRTGRTASARQVFDAVDVERLDDDDFPPPRNRWGQVRMDGELPWSILSQTEQGIIDKMRAVGTPLKEWDITIYRGITTGLNEAFIVDNQTKEALVAEDPKSAELLKPVLRGRDIRRYHASWNGQWLVATFPSVGLNIDDYPAIKRYLMSFGRDRLEQAGRALPNGSRSRKRTRHSWFELQDTCAYHEDFKKEKLFWMDMTPRGRFSYLGSEIYCNDKGFMMTGASLKYLCAVLNSSLITWRMRSAALTTGMGLLQWKKFAVERIPIPIIGPIEQDVFIQLVDGILQGEATDTNLDTSEGEVEIDRRVFELYGLTPSEILVISQGKSPLED